MIRPPPRTSHAAFHRRIGASVTRSGTRQWKQPDTYVRWRDEPDVWKDGLPPKFLYIPFNGAKSSSDVSNAIKKMINDFKLEGVKAEIGTSEEKAGGKVIPGMEILGPIFVSEKSKPDVIVTLPNNLVPLVFEVQYPSSEYEDAIYLTGSYLLDNFRLLRNLIQWKKWSAYLFPKPNEKGCVTRVDVTWIDKDLKFLLTYKPLSLGEYREDIRKKLNEQVEDVKQVESTEKDWKLKLHCGITLSEASLQHLAKVLKCGSWTHYMKKKKSSESGEPSAQRRKLNEEDEAESVVQMEQWPSLSSIIIASNGHMYKHIIDPQEQSKMMARIVGLGCDSDLYLLPIKHVLLTPSLSFLEYPVLEFPMTKAEVRKCFFHFAKGVSSALSSLHEDLFVAHLDVRLENVAFRRKKLGGNVFFSSIDSYRKIKIISDDYEYEAVLIDLDRHQETNLKWSNNRYEAGSIMYTVDPGSVDPDSDFTTEKLDWRQLGIMLYFCHTDADSYKKLKIEDMKKLKDPFINELLRGTLLSAVCIRKRKAHV